MDLFWLDAHGSQPIMVGNGTAGSVVAGGSKQGQMNLALTSKAH